MRLQRSLRQPRLTKREPRYGLRLLFLAILAAAALAPMAAAAASTTFAVADNTDFFGSDYNGFAPAGDSFYACVDVCRSDNACKAFTYARPGVKGPQAMCFLKNATPAPTANSCCISGVKSVTDFPVITIGPEATRTEGLDYPGGDYKRILTSAPNPDECARLCQGDDKCKSYTYVNPGVQSQAAVCYLKEAIRPSTNNNCCTSGVKSFKPTALDDVSLEISTNYPGMDYSALTLGKPDPYTCAYACKQDQKCRAYTFVNPQGGQPARCYLKSAVPARQGAACCISGVKTPDTGLKTALTRGAAPSPKWKTCGAGGALDVLDQLCDGSVLPLFTCEPPGVSSKCDSYVRQVPTGGKAGEYMSISTAPVQTLEGYPAYGARGKFLGEAAMCALRELSPKFVSPSGKAGKTASVGWSGSNFLGTISFRQDLGYLDFDPQAMKFTGYRNLSFCAPIVGCYDAIAQDFSVKLDKYIVSPPIRLGAPQTGGGQAGSVSIPKVIALDEFYALTFDADLADKSVTLLPPSFTVATPFGPIAVKPSFDYWARETVFAPPFQNVDWVTRKGGAGSGWPYDARLRDTFGADHAIAFPLITPGKGFGWQSQLALGNRDPRSAAAGGNWSPSGSYPERPDRSLRDARDNTERLASTGMLAKARLCYPSADCDPDALGSVGGLLPSWVPKGFLSFLVWVEPEARAAFSSQFDILSAHGRQPEAGDIGAGGANWSGADLMMTTNAANSFGFNINTGVDLVVKIPTIIGALTVVDVHPRLSKNLGEGPSFYDGTQAYFASEYDGVARTKPFSQFRTFLNPANYNGANNGANYVQACLATPKQLPVPPPTPTATPDDAKKLFHSNIVEVPCNICAYSKGNPKAPESYGKAHTFLPVSRPQGAKSWQCDLAEKSGCHDFCRLNTQTGVMTYLRPPDIGLKIPNNLEGKTYDGTICFKQVQIVK